VASRKEALEVRSLWDRNVVNRIKRHEDYKSS
jgi:hypothetical protein